MNFITDNYVWFIISGSVLLLITIGYYAEQTGFGKVKLKDSGKGISLENETDDSIKTVVLPQNVTLNQTIKTDVPINTPIEEISLPDNSNVNLSNHNFNNTPNIESNFNNNSFPQTMNSNSTNEVFPSNSIITPKIEDDDNDVWKF